MESEYVKQTVGPALALGLAEIALLRPTDPIEYLGLWLLNHKKNLQEVSQKVWSEASHNEHSELRTPSILRTLVLVPY